jgi:hypothetical protein
VDHGFLVRGAPANLASAVKIHEVVALGAARAGVDVVDVLGVNPVEFRLESGQMGLGPFSRVSDK